MANTQLQQWIVDKLQDPQWGSHHKVKIYNPWSKTKKEADWCWKYANGKAILIEDKEERDTDLNDAIDQLENTNKTTDAGYRTLLIEEGYNDIISIAIKDTGSGKKVHVLRNGQYISDELNSISYYETLLGARKQIDISKEIYQLTAKINQILHDEFKITHLQDRMLFTGCVLVASTYSSGRFEQFNGIEDFKSSIVRNINGKFSKPEIKIYKINQLTQLFSSINVGAIPSNTLIQELCEICNQIRELMQSNPLTDIDIMNIFFTEFNRYRGKSESGQVFTPDHISKLMAELLNISKDDHILDPCCGSGSLILSASKFNNKNFDNIFGNDFDMNVLRLSYINMLLHNDGITNLIQKDARDTTLKTKDKNDFTFVQWIKNKKITKVIANPPYEQSFAIDILENVVNNVEKECRIVWLMPNNKMEKIKKAKKLLEKNTLSDIILLGDIFPKTGCGDVSLFIFTKGIPQNDKKIKCWHIDDKFETVKNQGYQDVKGTWPKIKQEFLESFELGKCDKEIDPKDRLSYPKEFKIEDVSKEDIEMTLLQYMLFQQGPISSKNTVQSSLKLMLEFMNINNLEDKIEFLKKVSKDVK